ncbi:hypothetical protein [Actinomadura litoris]|uniref:hypothetical protein n=1 Tax=Actinomadura litoris TaxID=2678616 RepID=UPI001FA794D6|nr:hypothetical protein [Actinomadura litoris]
MEEFPAFVKHEGMPSRPVEVRRADKDLRWRVVETLALDREVEYCGVAAEAVCRLRVFGPLPYHPRRDGTFELMAINYKHRAYWWISLPATR